MRARGRVCTLTLFLSSIEESPVRIQDRQRSRLLYEHDLNTTRESENTYRVVESVQFVDKKREKISCIVDAA